MLTKDVITKLFSEKLISKAKLQSRNVVASYRNDALATVINAHGLRSTHEEADTKLLLHATHAAKRRAEQIRIYSPDTDISVLAIRRALILPDDTVFVTLGPHKREISVRKIFDALGVDNVAALPGLHALPGADIAGSFAGKAKTSFWKRFMDTPKEILQALTALGETEEIPNDVFRNIEAFICSVYATLKHHQTFDMANLRWWFYTNRQAKGKNMPPTSASLRPAIRRAHFQCIECYRDIVAYPNLSSPSQYGWSMVNGKYEAVMCDLPCAPSEVIDVIRCSCKTGRCAPPCKCANEKPPLPCT